MSTTAGSNKRLAVVLGVANHRSIAYACVQSFLAKGVDCILTYQSTRFESTIEKLIAKEQQQQQESDGDGFYQNQHQHRRRHRGHIVGSFRCNVGVDGELERLFQEQIPETIDQQQLGSNSSSGSGSHHHYQQLDALVHSIAYANFEKQQPFSHASWDAFAESQRISSYSFLRAAHLAKPLMNTNSSSDENAENAENDDGNNRRIIRNNSPSMTALTYLGSIRSVPNYHIMGPAKASLESIVRGLAMEYGHGSGGSSSTRDSDIDDTNENNNNNTSIIRVNAVSAGPVSTLASRGIPQFGQLYKQVAEQSPLGRPVTVQEIADTVQFVAMDATAITGQVLYVDGGYSSIVPIG